MSWTLVAEAKAWPLHEPFVISRGSQTTTDTILVTLIDGEGKRGRGEGCGVPYAGETPASMHKQIEAVRPEVEAGIDRQGLLRLLPPGGARCALDAALWDLEAKRSHISAFALAGVAHPRAVASAYTIGMRAIDAYEPAAAARSKFQTLKIKAGNDDPVAAIAAARRGAPASRFIVDPNQSWGVETLKTLAPALVDLGVVLLEQPIKVGDEAGLDGYRCPIPLCADELINDCSDLAKARGRFDVVNIKLDKTGGLTEALRLAELARAQGFELMVGCMLGSSLGMAPAVVLAQQCAFVDLDGPLLQAEDWPEALHYREGVISPPEPALWG